MGVGGAQLGPRRHVSLAWIINAPAFSTRGNCVAAKANGSHRAHLSLNLNYLTGSLYDVRADLVTREPRVFWWKWMRYVAVGHANEIMPSDNWPIFQRNDQFANGRSRAILDHNAIINSASLKPRWFPIRYRAINFSAIEWDNGRPKREDS
jgi:hypothetical protein